MSIPEPEGRSCCKLCGAVYRASFKRCPRDGGVIERVEGDPLAGETLADRYIMVRCIGEGAMGLVYLAEHARMRSRQFALKVLFGDLAADDKMRERFAREAEAAARLNHNNIVSVVDFGESEAGLLYMAMDFIEGEDMGELIEREGPLAQERVVALMRQLCRGLQHAHDRGLVHRDFKPDNVILTRDDDGGELCKIADFGLAMFSDPGQGGDRLTTMGMVLGTPAYISPEQATDRPVDHRSDLYSLGAVVYEMLAGKPLFDGTALEVARQQVGADPLPISVRAPRARVDADLERIVMKLLRKHAEDRYASAADVVAALDQLAARTARFRFAIEPEGDLDARALAPTAAMRSAEIPAQSPAALRPVSPTADSIVFPPPAPTRRRPQWALLIAIGALLAGVVAIAVVTSGGAGDPGGESPAVAADPVNPAVAAADPVDPAVDPTAPSIDPTAATIDPPGVATTTAGVAANSDVDAAPTAGSGSAAVPGATDNGVPAAGTEDTAATDAGAAPPRRRKHRKRTRPTGARTKVDTATDDPAADAEITVQQLTARYRAVGSAVDRLEREKGAAVAAPFRTRYFAIPFADALRVPSMRREALTRLTKLSREIKKSM